MYLFITKLDSFAHSVLVSVMLNQLRGGHLAKQWPCCLGHLHPASEHLGSVPSPASDASPLIVYILGSWQGMVQGVETLPPKRETWSGFQAPGFGPVQLCHGMASVWGVVNYWREELLYLSILLDVKVA